MSQQTSGKFREGTKQTCADEGLAIGSFSCSHPSAFLSPVSALLMVDFVGDETVLSGLEVCLVQAVAAVDHLLVLRGPLTVVLSAACSDLIGVWVLQDLGDVHLLRWMKTDIGD